MDTAGARRGMWHVVPDEIEACLGGLRGAINGAKGSLSRFAGLC